MKTAQRLGTWLLVSVSFVLAPAANEAQEANQAATEQNEGQADLDKAIVAKLSAKSYQRITGVVNLAQAALNKGLDEENTRFAKNLLASTLMDRATLVSTAILDRKTRDPNWARLRAAAVTDLQRLLGIDPSRYRANYLLGRLLALPGGDNAQAVEAFGKAIDSEGADNILRAKSLTMRANLQTDEAKRLADYAAAIDVAPNDPEALRTRAIYFLLKGKTDQAIADFDRALEIDPEHAATHEVRGSAFLLKKDYDEALSSFDRASELNPDSASPHIQRGRLFNAQGNTEAAIAAFDKAIKITPDAPNVLMMRSELRLLNENAEGALADADEVLRLAPDNVDARRWRAQVHLIGSQTMDEAIDSLERLAQAQPKDAESIGDNAAALRKRADILARSGKIDEAIATVERLTKILPDDAVSKFQLGMYYNRNEQPRHAIKVFGTLVAKDGKNWQALRSRGDANLSIGEQAAAIADYQAALEMQPEDTGLLNNLSWVLATSPDENLRAGDRALQLATKACELTEYKAAHILSTLAAAYAEIGDFEAAIEWSEKSVELARDEIRDQLLKETDSYRASKPLRESQSIEEKEPEQ